MTARMCLRIADHRGHRSGQERCGYRLPIAITSTTDPVTARRPRAHLLAFLDWHVRAPRAKGAPRHARPALQSP